MYLFSFFTMSNDIIIKILVVTLLWKYETMKNLFDNSCVNKLFIIIYLYERRILFILKYIIFYLFWMLMIYKIYSKW